METPATPLPHGLPGAPTLLLAVSDDWLRGALATAFRTDGWQVRLAPDGDAAWRAFLEAAGDFDLLLSEARLPGLEGTALAGRLRALRPELPGLLVDPDPEPGARRFCRRQRLRLARLPLPLGEIVLRARKELRRAAPVHACRPPASVYAVA